MGGWVRGFTSRFESEHLFQTPFGDSDVVWISVNVSDTQQGDAHLILTREGQVSLIDGGGEGEANRSLLPFLRKYHIAQIDHLLITHPHTDHYGGAIALMEAGFPIGEIYWAEPSLELCKSEPWGCFPEEIEKLKMLAVHMGVRLKSLNDLDTISIGPYGQLKKVFHALPETCPVEKCSINDFSLIAELRVGLARALFTGDLDNAVAKWLLENRKSKWFEADILKVPHHGTTSLPSNAFFEAVNPSVAIVPGSHALWCEDRSREPREWFLAHHENTKTFVSGVNGHVRVNFFRDGRYWIGTEFFEKRPINCRRRTIFDKLVLFR